MGYYGKLGEKRTAQTLRGKGYSYKEILQHVHVSKDTISRWCKEITLSKSQEQRLIVRKSNGQKKGSLIAAENKRRKRIETIRMTKIQAKKQIGVFTNRDKFITGIALYAGEGTKTDGQVAFSNANPALIEFMIHWFYDFCHVSTLKLRGALWLHEGKDEKHAMEFWSTISGIPKNQFYKTYIAKNKVDSMKIRKNIHPFGVFAIRISDSALHRRIMGWCSALFHDKIADTNTERISVGVVR
jgi:hypothetical protein